VKPELIVKDPKKLKHLHQLELEQMKENIKYCKIQQVLDIDFKPAVIDTRKKNKN